MIISIIGGSGSGKDTQASKLSKKFNLPHISMGGILRIEEKKGNALAIQAMQIANKGKWVPDKITSKILLNYLQKNNLINFIVTGYPRFLKQCKTFETIIDKLKSNLKAVILLDIPQNIMYQRILKQKQEKQIGGKREDTSQEAIQGRINSYLETIDPVIDYYAKKDLLIKIDSTPKIEVVYQNILDQLELNKKK